MEGLFMSEHLMLSAPIECVDLCTELTVLGSMPLQLMHCWM